MHRITFTIGQGKDRDGNPFEDIERLRHEACQHLAYLFGGYTAVLGYGGWLDDSRELIEEPSLVLTVITNKLQAVESSAKYLKEIFRQSCVVVTVDPTNVQFI